MQRITIFIALFALYLISAQYQNLLLVKVRLDTQEKFDRFFSLFPKDTLDMWSCDQGAAVGVDMTIVFSYDMMPKLAALGTDFFDKDAKLEIVNANIQQMVENETKMIQKIREEQEQKLKAMTPEEQEKFLLSADEYFKSYHKTADVYAFFDNLVKQHPDQMERFVIGKSIKGADIVLYRIHSKGSYNPSKPGVFFNSVLHAREWISVGTTNFIAHSLLTKDTSFLDKVNIHYVPVVNPDGYDYTWTANRLWRKNLRADGSQIFGVDLNRNWASGFGGEGSSGSKWSETYRGTHANSEPETKAVHDYMLKTSGIKGSIDFHSYSQLVMRPWGKSRSTSPDDARLRDLGAKMVSAIRSAHGKSYTNQRAAELYVASGIMSDAMYETYRVSTAYTIELRPTGGGYNGFILPPDQIIPTGEENLAAVKELINAVVKSN